MRIIGVLDVQNGLAVHARGGDRAHYGPVASILHDQPDPIALATAYRDRLGLKSVYLADLDAIAGHPPNLRLLRGLADLNINVWIDAGVHIANDAQPLFDEGASVVIAGLETLRGPMDLWGMIARFGPEQIAFSLDLREGRPVVETWGTDDPLKIASIAAECGISRMIVLDLARVGSGSGVGTLDLIAAIRSAHPSLEIIAGGGVSDLSDLHKLTEAGAAGALIGSALHDGRIGSR